jgi:hypothetical protein
MGYPVFVDWSKVGTRPQGLKPGNLRVPFQHD